MNLNNPQDRKTIEETLKMGQETDFWQVIKQGVENNVKHLEQEWENGDSDDLPPEEYKSKMQNLKYRKKIWQSMLQLPQLLISQLGQPDQSEPDFDPYEH